MGPENIGKKSEASEEKLFLKGGYYATWTELKNIFFNGRKTFFDPACLDEFILHK